MFKTPKQYAALMLAGHHHDKEAALVELYSAARAYPQTPAKFFRDVAVIIERTQVTRVGNDVITEQPYTQSTEWGNIVMAARRAGNVGDN